MSMRWVLDDYEQCLQQSKKILPPVCHVCKVCDGKACAGHASTILEFGAKGGNGGFTWSVQRLGRYRIVMDPIHEDFDPDTRCSLFGREFDLPVFASPIGRILSKEPISSPYYNTNERYADAVVKGCCDAGGMAWTGDAKERDYFLGQIRPMKAAGGTGVPTIKPWRNREEFWYRVDAAREAGVMAIATDLDAIGLGYQHIAGENPDQLGVSSRTEAELREIVEKIDRPVVFKGIMSARAALKCKRAGAYGILVSNHGGNIIENSEAPCDVLPEIREAVRDEMKVFVDGGVRSGEDVFKLLALGADAVGIGRPYAAMVYGTGYRGAFIYTQKIYLELKAIMQLAGCRTLADITRDKIIIS